MLLSGGGGKEVREVTDTRSPGVGEGRGKGISMGYTTEIEGLLIGGKKRKGCRVPKGEGEG